MMLNKPSLRCEIAEYQKQWKLLSDKLSTLERDRILETHADEKFRLEKEIEEIKAKLLGIEQQLCKLETQKETLEFIKDYMLERQISPSVEEIKEYLGKRKLKKVRKILNQLKKKRYINYIKEQVRSIALTKLALEYFGMKPLTSPSPIGIVKAGRVGVTNFSDIPTEHIYGKEIEGKTVYIYII